jgi:multidrug resistance efflux pump
MEDYSEPILVTVRQVELDRLHEICEELAENYKEIKANNEELKAEIELKNARLTPIKIDLDRYKDLDIDDIDLNKNGANIPKIVR